MRKSKQAWSCDSIFNAYENYIWPFSCQLPDQRKVTGANFQESDKVLNTISVGMKEALENQDSKQLLSYSRSALQWGGVLRSNYGKLENMGENIISYFQMATNKLNPETVDTDDDFFTIHMKSGYTKLYSFLIPEFVIYDSRVGAALGFLVRLFLEENHMEEIPETLHFSYGNARPTKSGSDNANSRNPSNDKYKFRIMTTNKHMHIKHNIYANWLLSEVASQSRFSVEEDSMRRLEAALFMIGYQVTV